MRRSNKILHQFIMFDGRYVQYVIANPECIERVQFSVEFTNRSEVHTITREHTDTDTHRTHTHEVAREKPSRKSHTNNKPITQRQL